MRGEWTILHFFSYPVYLFIPMKSTLCRFTPSSDRKRSLFGEDPPITSNKSIRQDETPAADASADYQTEEVLRPLDTRDTCRGCGEFAIVTLHFRTRSDSIYLCNRCKNKARLTTCSVCTVKLTQSDWVSYRRRITTSFSRRLPMGYPWERDIYIHSECEDNLSVTACVHCTRTALDESSREQYFAVCERHGDVCNRCYTDPFLC